ncbi:nuclear transport factor 2 family protein [Pseudoclavibacter sp. RFBA6]|uniref:nuclear transport factor 2 family protein n=1 Tax=Pseudoclavibacter sp. RFBA6 TaxID=2080573 RepID=UPI000CE723E4|nr:nuclear transport factor 2 family protein [Pseudoclavibacter sp. RFBA6]PPG43235.1 polyketide cyclase [Pseudoclavibacter sp. RFBA6]
MLYARIVEGKVRTTFAEINAGNYMAMVDSLGTPFVYKFHGDHALGGSRTTRQAMVRWWQRVGDLLPGAQFTILEVMVRGGPWHTRVAVRSTVRGPLPDGAEYRNTVVQFMTLRWGKVVDVETLEDLQHLAQALAAVAATGNSEATATAITD